MAKQSNISMDRTALHTLGIFQSHVIKHQLPKAKGAHLKVANQNDVTVRVKLLI